MTADPSLVRQGARRLFVSKDLERIADHATGIARTVIFVVDGKKCAARESELRVGEKGRARFRTSFGLLVSVEVNIN
jgi:phosphate uptake regulator